MPPDLTQLVHTAATATGAAQVRAAARLMTLLENAPQRLPELLLAMRGGGADPRRADPPACRLVLGVTGAPGAGKSTLADVLVAEHRRRHPGRRVGVIAVDPSSPFTGGAVLGDRVRMMRHATDPMVFVRSMATRGHLGGLALGVRGVLHVLSLIGCDLILIETVGVGQSEIEIFNVADLTAIVFAPGQGDSIQLLKAGLMEIGDLFVVNKADKPGAEELHNQILGALHLGLIEHACGPHHSLTAAGRGLQAAPAPAEPAGTPPAAKFTPEVHLVSSVEGQGIDGLLASLDQAAERFGGQWMRHRQTAVADEIREEVLEQARRRVAEVLGANGMLNRQIQRVLDGAVTIDQLAHELLRKAATEAPPRTVPPAPRHRKPNP